MARLLLHEQRISAVLHQMRDIAVAQAMHAQLHRQAELVAVGGEARVYVLRRHPPTALGQNSAPESKP